MTRTSFAAALAATTAVLAVPAYAQDSAREESRAGRVEITPYIEAAQVLNSQLEPFSDTVTYTSLAAGVDAGFTGRSSAGTVSLRYERRIGWSDDQQDGDTISGIARASLALVPNAVTFEAGGLASRTRVDGNGGQHVPPAKSSGWGATTRPHPRSTHWFHKRSGAVRTHL